MKMVSRFIWTNWAKGKVLQQNEKAWQGEHNGYKRLPDPVNHKRTVLSLGADRWLIVDHLRGKQLHDYALHWLLSDFPYQERKNLLLLSIDSIQYKVQLGVAEGKSILSVVRGDENSTRGWRSRYYGEREPAISVMLKAQQLEAIFWSFFGLEGDSVEQSGSLLNIAFEDREISIDLQSPLSNF
jgi:hypothetical protein